MTGRGTIRLARVTLFLYPLLLAGSGSILVARAAPENLPSLHATPSKLVLTGSDVHRATGATFTIRGTVVPNAAVAVIEKVSVATMNRYRLTGYDTLFSRVARSGVVVILDSVGLYKSPSAAKWEYKLFTSENKAPAGSKTISMSGIGDQARGLVNASSTAASVYFQRGVYTARIDITGLGGSVSSLAISLSKILDGRMKKG